MELTAPIECTYCHRAGLPPAERETTPWPADEEIVSCDFHDRVRAEIDEARAMEAG